MNYDAFAKTFSESRKDHPWPELDAIIEDMKSCKFESILDVGCGNGRFLEEAKKRDFLPKKYLGTDNSQGMIEEATKLHPNYDFKVIPMEEPHAGLGSYDAILFLASFHHLETEEERIQVLKNLHPLLSEDGRIYLTNWNLREQPRYEKSHRGNGDFDIKIGEYSRYYHGFTLGELWELFEKSDWKVLKNELFIGGRNFLSILSH